MQKEEADLFEKATKELNKTIGRKLIGSELSKEFKHPAVQKLIEENPKYYAAIQHYIESGMSEVDALKQLIIDRNTLFRMYGVFGNTEQEAFDAMKTVSDKYALELSPNSVNNNLGRSQSGSDIGTVYATSSTEG